MPNAIKYNTNPETLALRKGDFYIGTGDVGKGPTSSTGYYNGITPPPGGYTIYVNKASGGPSIKVASNEAELIAMTNEVGGTSFTTTGECLNYFATQTDKMCLNRDYEQIVTNGLTYSFDFGFSPGYPKSGTTFYDLRSTNNGTLYNEPTFSSNNGGEMTFDGSSDYAIVPNNDVFNFGSNPFTIEVWSNITNGSTGARCVIDKIGNLFTVGPGWQFQSIPNSYFWRFSGPSGVSILANTYTSTGGYIYCAITSTGMNGNTENVTLYTQYGTDAISISDVTSSFSTFTLVNNSEDLNIGRRGIGASYMSGGVAIFRIYNRQLSQTEIESNFNNQRARFGY